MRLMSVVLAALAALMAAQPGAVDAKPAHDVIRQQMESHSTGHEVACHLV